MHLFAYVPAYLLHRDMGELNFRFVFLGFIGLFHSQRHIEQGSSGSGKISLLIEHHPEVKAIVHLFWAKMRMKVSHHKRQRCRIMKLFRKKL